MDHRPPDSGGQCRRISHRLGQFNFDGSFEGRMYSNVPAPATDRLWMVRRTPSEWIDNRGLTELDQKSPKRFGLFLFYRLRWQEWLQVLFREERDEDPRPANEVSIDFVSPTRAGRDTSPGGGKHV